MICAEIELMGCVDLLDISWVAPLKAGYKSLVKALRASGTELPKQARTFSVAKPHPLDRAVINYTLEFLRTKGLEVRSIRSVFREGRRIYKGLALYDRNHVQIAVLKDEYVGRRWIHQSSRRKGGG